MVKIVSILLAIGLGLVMAFFTLSDQYKKTQPSEITLNEQAESLLTPSVSVPSPQRNLAEPIILPQEPKELLNEQDLNTVSDDITIEEPKQIWQLATVADQLRPKSLPDNIHVEYIKITNTQALTFSEGKKISLLIPQENKHYLGTVDESTSEFGGNVIMSSGEIDNGSEFSSFSISEGKKTTFITVATGESIYQIEIDQKSGIGVVFDDRELDQFRHDDDGILPPPEGM